MTISVFDLFKVGIGPSSSHTVGPMKAAGMFAGGLRDDGLMPRVRTVRVSLYGSLGLTGPGHGSDKAVLLGLEGERPATVDVDAVPARLEAIRRRGTVRLLGEHEIAFTVGEHLEFNRRKKLGYHPNGMRFTAYDGAGAAIRERAYYSIGGGFVADETARRRRPARRPPDRQRRGRTARICPIRSRPARNCSPTPGPAACPFPGSCSRTRRRSAGRPSRSGRTCSICGRSCGPASSVAAAPTACCPAA